MLDYYTPSGKHLVIHDRFIQLGYTLSRHWLGGDCLYLSCQLSYKWGWPQRIFIIPGNLLFDMHIFIRLARGTDNSRCASLSNLPGIPSYPVAFLMFRALSFRWITSGLISMNTNVFALSANLPLIFTTLGWFLCFSIELVIDIILSSNPIVDAILEKKSLKISEICL